MNPDFGGWASFALLFLLGAGWFYTHMRIDKAVEAHASMQVVVIEIKAHIGRFISHEESERGTRERENTRIHEEFKSIRMHQTTMHQNIAVLTEQIKSLVEDSRHRNSSFNALISSLPRQREP